MVSLASSICHVMRVMYETGLACTGGNASGRLDQERFLITPAGAAADFVGQLTPDDLARVSTSREGAVEGSASSETPVHRALYNALPWVNGVVHSHPRHILALSQAIDEWPHVTSSSRWFRGSVRLLAEGEPATSELMSQIFSDVNDGSTFRYGVALFTPQHGVFVASRSVQRALYYLNKLEENAYVSLLRSRA